MLKIYGASDDLIEVEGDIREEFGFNSKDDNDHRYLAVSDGTLLKIFYDQDGIWRIHKIMGGRSEFSKIEGDVEKDTPEIVTLAGGTVFKWVVMGKDLAK